MKHCVLQDSSFLVATLDPTDDFHKDAVFIFRKIIKNRRKVKVIIPSLVFYETIVTLIKKGGLSKASLEKKLWNFLYSDLVLSISMLETSAFKVCKKLKYEELRQLSTQDFIIVNAGIDYQAQILTFDKQMRKRVGDVYSEIYYCSNVGGMVDETEKFLSDLYTIIGKNIEGMNLMPF